MPENLRTPLKCPDMLVFSKAKLVFLSMPKTGSTAFEHALAPLAAIAICDPPALKHAPLYRYNRFYRPMIDKFIGEKMDIMAVVREPVSWLGSWYRYRQRADMLGKANATHDISFDDFVLAYCRSEKPSFAKVGSQSRFLRPTPNGLHATHLFRYEDQDSLVGFLEKRLATSVSPLRLNTSSGQVPDLSRATKALLYATWPEDFDLWNSIQPGGVRSPELNSV